MLVAIDTETTGIDLFHHNLPHLVTITDAEGPRHWGRDWDFNLYKRLPQPAPADLHEIQEVIANAERLVLHNAKFDVIALSQIIPSLDWPWAKTEDTLIAGHVLASNQPHNLTDMVAHYLGKDIEPYEKRLREAVLDCRRQVGKHFPKWRIAEKGLPELPSAKEKVWAADGWLPRRYAEAVGWEEDHPYHTVLEEYADVDSTSTYYLWLVLEAELRRRGLWKIYREQMRVAPIAVGMEMRGVTAIASNHQELLQEYREEERRASQECIQIAEDLGYDLQLPKGNRNGSLMGFCFGVPEEGDSPLFPRKKHYLNLPVVNRTETGQPSLDSKIAIPTYLDTLPAGSPGHRFVSALAERAQRNTAISYLESYARFWLPLPGVPAHFLLHPSLNQTGTDTLRWSSSNPNSQNISKRGIESTCKSCQGTGLSNQEDEQPCPNCKGEGVTVSNLRYCFGPAPGREWWSVDAQNIELRLPAYEANEREMIALFEEPEKPPYYGSNHLLNFSAVYPDLWEGELKEVGLDKVGPHCKKKYKDTWYQWCKNGGFAVQYGAIDRSDGIGTADRAFHKRGAHALLKRRFTAIHGPGGLNERCIRFAEKHGYVETIPDKTVDPTRGYPLLCTRTEYGKILPTVPLNYRIQGSACWWMRRAMVRCEEQLAEWRGQGYQGFICMQIHDELVFDLPKRAHPKVAPGKSNLARVRVLQRLMSQGGTDLGIPTPTAAEYHPRNWAEGISV